MSNRITGLNAFRKFYDYQKAFYPKAVSYSFDDLLKSYGKKAEISLVGVGDMIVNGDVSILRLDSALKNLARDSHGKMLKNPVQISNYIQSVEAKIDWIDAAAFVVTESTKDVIKGAQSVGDSILLTGKILNFLLPVILLGAVFFYLDNKSGGKLSGSLKR